ncbi:Single-stranded DNA-specific exonuclease, DHH superfamily, may be involved in DNA replication intiation [Stigmatella aurantiaca]|uniref:Single-stranded DNA-specific exonuclease, DHH superfamily, may be involved in DNA replication intiation n=2 Tax=Stigmatella aurantiaca TaxID=41 RepID=A0A1H8E7J1_STIAU|nr:Single-stranded DNA-specific exonuclease, DHH superfamily, may be involved in DNA replication intiation [Stigmatella aurantiaca]
MLLGHTEESDWPASSEAMAEARNFLGAQKGKHVLIAPHTDVDGLSSCVLAVRAAEAVGARVTIRVPGKGEHAHSPAFQERLRRVRADALLVLDMGSRPGAVVPELPSLIVDHHASTAFPEGAHVLSGYGHEPVAPTSLLTYALVSPWVIPGPLEWLAVMGTAADLGVGAPIPGLKDALRRAGRKAVTEAVALLNAARRSSQFAAPLALDVLMQAGNASDISEGRIPGVEALRDCRLEVQREVGRCAKTPPRFAGNVALLLFSSGAQIHPLVAVRWAQRLPEHIVIAANTGYLPDRVNFVLRSRTEKDLIAFLRGLNLPPMGGEFANGHAQATGGSLTAPDFLRFIEALGFRGLRSHDVERRGVAPG